MCRGACAGRGLAVGNWTLVGDELSPLSNRRGPTKLAFALLLRFYALMPTIYVVLLALTVVLAVFFVTSHSAIAAAVSVLLLGATAFGTVPPLQMRVLAKAKDAPAVASAFNISAFNVANAGGSFIGGRVIATGFGFPVLGPVAAIISFLGLLIALYSGRLDTRGKESARTVSEPAGTGELTSVPHA